MSNMPNILEFLRLDERVEKVHEQQGRDNDANEHCLIPSSVLNFVQMWRKEDKK